MARKKTNSNKKKNKQKRQQTKYDPTKTMNFLPEAGPGCHIVRLHQQNDSQAKGHVVMEPRSLLSKIQIELHYERVHKAKVVHGQAQ